MQTLVVKAVLSKLSQHRTAVTTLKQDSRLSGALIPLGKSIKNTHVGSMAKHVDSITEVLPKIMIDLVTLDISYVDSRNLSNVVILGGSSKGSSTIDPYTLPPSSYIDGTSGFFKSRFQSVLPNPATLEKRADHINKKKGYCLLSSLSFFKIPELRRPSNLPWPAAEPPVIEEEEIADDASNDSEDRDPSPQPRRTVHKETSATNKRKRTVFYGLKKPTPFVASSSSSSSFQLNPKEDFQNLINLGVDQALEERSRAATS
mmetsp:Transcript_13747/g.22695  ORF Transcript_13747/g.22695 Transcript_13747/m.22695 type:complete len:260 (+) Transcript_13747:2873-3652(+)|eukprot:CAMPEP_0184651620 /NCGR_PEP_ID=MMETSP0308-20130426/9257_1 /TAXON_ID=38269 /ORGANISM="Gloeochaete witrockiana, Strain SAG 46.84" /LENGTH=259 /DNA_ID=CAMNT_0027085975 /DNA_START=2856 /DNA_END=3635 /DNA_ORIENTATION=-